MGNVYQIMNNPLLTSGGKASAEQIKSRAAPIYARLASYEPFAPITATAVSDWSVQAGDIIAIATDDGVRKLPVYTQKIRWNGGATSVYESTGSETRPVQSVELRQQYSAEASTSRRFGGVGSRLDKQEENLNYAWLDINESKAQIALRAYTTEVNELGEQIRVETGVYVDGINKEIRLKADKTYVDRLIADEIDAAIANIQVTVAEAVATKYVRAEEAFFPGRFSVGGKDYAAKTIPVVSSFTQASGETVTGDNVTFLATAVSEKTFTPDAGETITDFA